MPPSRTKPGTAFEIRFCDNNIVQVYDLTRRQKPTDKHLLPNEYPIDDVLKGRLRYSKLGNHRLSRLSGGSSKFQAFQLALSQHQQKDTEIEFNEDNEHISQEYSSIAGMESNAKDPVHPSPSDSTKIPTVVKRQIEMDEKELAEIRKGQEAVRKAMERKAKIQNARKNAKRGPVGTNDNQYSVCNEVPKQTVLEHTSGKDASDKILDKKALEQESLDRLAQKPSYSHINTPIPAKLPRIHSINDSLRSNGRTSGETEDTLTSYQRTSTKYSSLSSPVPSLRSPPSVSSKENSLPPLIEKPNGHFNQPCQPTLPPVDLVRPSDSFNHSIETKAEHSPHQHQAMLEMQNEYHTSSSGSCCIIS
ncbi:hypothetical protein CLU79DRAFT_265646 [Phycomyces nitens]|nr:hypothetical protein CLU79DRAFT_265646 [Phycomyces nitens]